MLTSTARFLVLALVALASASAKTFNMDPQFAIHTISNEYQLFLIETLVKNVDATLLSKVTPVKKQVEEQLASGKTGLYAIAKQIGDLIVALDKAKPGFQDAILEYGKKNPIAFYSITNIYPEASWDFLYAASKKAATELKSDKIAANLEKLNDDFEATFHGGTPDATKLVAAFDKFTEESEAIAPGYGDLLLTIGDAEVDKYRAKLLKLQQQAASGQSITDEQLTAGDSSSASPSPSPSPSTEKAAEKTEKPTASPAGSTTGEIATAGNVTDAPTVVATTAPVVTTIAPTATPKSSASSHSAVLTVIVSVAVAAITSFAI